MSKYSHFEMCEKIFGQKYKWNEQKHDYEPYSRTDMWNKMIEQQDKISDLEAKLAKNKKWLASNEGFLENQKLKQQLADMTEKYELASCPTGGLVDRVRNLEQQLAEKDKEIEYQESMKILAVENQNKKAIEQLEKVKAELVNNISPIKLSYTEYVQKVYETIKQQINELKGDK